MLAQLVQMFRQDLILSLSDSRASGLSCHTTQPREGLLPALGSSDSRAKLACVESLLYYSLVCCVRQATSLLCASEIPFVKGGHDCKSRQASGTL